MQWILKGTEKQKNYVVDISLRKKYVERALRDDSLIKFISA
jgi:hypothetical protein